jgi:hypothetical protein
MQFKSLHKTFFRYNNPGVQLDELPQELFPPDPDFEGNDQPVDPVMTLGGQLVNLEEKSMTIKILVIEQVCLNWSCKYFWGKNGTMSFCQMTFCQTTFCQMTFRQMTFRQTTFRQKSFRQTMFCQMTFCQIVFLSKAIFVKHCDFIVPICPDLT